MIDFVIHYQKTVVGIFENIHLDWRVLFVVLVNVELKSLAYLPRIDYRYYTRGALVQHREDSIINIVINKNNS